MQQVLNRMAGTQMHTYVAYLAIENSSGIKVP
jgi:hypothetical protein